MLKKISFKILSFLFLNLAEAFSHPKSVVSLDVCADHWTLALARPFQIQALSYFAKDPSTSLVFKQAETYATHQGSLEEILLLKPDLVIADTYTSPLKVSLLKKMGLTVYVIPPQQTVEDTLKIEEELTTLLGNNPTNLAKVLSQPPVSKPLKVLFYTKSGQTIGKNTPLNSLFKRVGFINLAATYPSHGWFSLPLEELLILKPEILFLSLPLKTPGPFLQVHPIISQLKSHKVSLSPALFMCTTPLHLIQLHKALRASIKTFLRQEL